MSTSTVTDEGVAGAAPAEPVKSLLTVREVADRLRLSTYTIRRRAKEDPAFPQPFVVGGQQHRWDASAVECYLAEQRRRGRTG